MAEATLLVVAKSVLEQLASPASNEFLLLWNIEKDRNNLHLTIETITAFLDDAEQRGSNDHLVRVWLSRLRTALYEADDLFDAMAARALRMTKVMSGNSFRKEVSLLFSKSKQPYFVVRTAHDIKDIKERLDVISKDMSQFNFMSKRIEENPTRAPVRFRNETHSFVKLEDVIGRDREKDELIELLLPKEENRQLSLSVISVIGFGGLGKTTLAQFVYNDIRVQWEFDLCLWACVNYFSDLKEVLVAILTSVLGSIPKDTNLDHLQRELREKIRGKKYLLVLDDVWDEEQSNWRELKKVLDCGDIGSKILATTRSKEVAQCLNAIEPYYSLKTLSEESAWDLFAKSTFEEGEYVDDHSEFIQLGKEIVRKCGYAPLAVITVGSMLRSKGKDKKMTWLSLVDNELAVILADNKDDPIMKVLMISYKGLPPALKHCFAYCSIFPKDHEFKKDELVRMWAAQGFIEPQAMKSLEEVGEVYFFHMVDRCFFQVLVTKTSKGCLIYTYKMHDLLHDLAIKVAGMESRCFIREDLEGKGGGSSFRHISVKCNPNFLFDPFLLSPHSKTLRTLLLVNVENFKTSSLNLILGCFKVLRILQMSYLGVDMLRDSFGGLIHLRYLDLSNSQRLKKIPNSITKLQHLQTLDLKNCYSLMELPLNLGNLVSLRHLDLSSCRKLKKFPKSICELQHLQTLDLRSCESLEEWPLNLGKLVSLRHLFLNGCKSLGCLPPELAEITTLVSLDRVIVHPRAGGLKYLGCLDDLRGVVRIELPKKGGSDCIEDARDSKMSKKHKLNGMIIEWIYDGEPHEMIKEETEEVLEAVQPHKNLQYLSIERYAGDKLSSWVFSLSNLKELTLYECTLEYLYQTNVKFESILPCLEILKMKSLHNLKGWWREEVAIPGDDSPIFVSPPLSRVSKVLISDCPDLVEGMPLFTGVEKLNLRGVSGKLVGKLLNTRAPNLQKISLRYVEDLSCVPKDSIQCLTSLKSLEIENSCDIEWVSSSGLAYLTALEELRISNCGNVKLEDRYEEAETEDINNIGSGMGMPWQALQRLRRLIVPWQKHLQGGLQYLTSLEYLVIEYYENKQVEEDNEMVEKGIFHLPALQTLYIGFNEMSYSCFPEWIQHLRFLKKIAFSGVELSMSWAMLANMNYLQNLSFERVEKVVNVDETEVEQQIQFISLIQLKISFTEDGSWIHSIPWKVFKSLRVLKLNEVGYYLWNIPDGFKHLTSLQDLFIRGSPKLRKRCEPETGEDWHLISHIPKIKIEWWDHEAHEMRELSVKEGGQ